MNDTAGATTQWLTQEAHDRLTAELENLSTVGRSEIAKRIEAARDEGDLKENGGYHAAKDEQGKIEARIRTLAELLRTAVVGIPPTAHGVVEPGTVVTATIFGDDERFLLGNREIADGSDLQVFSEKSAMGAAIHGKSVGESTTYTAPNGKRIEVKVLAAKPYTS